MSTLSTKKLLNSKWTKLNPENKEKHFLVVRIDRDEEEQIVDCVIEAVLSRRQSHIKWRDLADSTQWQSGWSR
ncbi:TIGR02450 family Trp-rich protein [Arenicella xantha]|uniref:Importin N-terminal domain-containing protein n=1 Tax=Arenicella xantha TaxID=644221 RepID=A0A395JKR8_9GAMM|nr:TIGR02450 family Trp-rich protein [Arenicella xantha]RBP51301.1 tryptophan-rich hypothetical protein [Arenicella xantha]